MGCFFFYGAEGIYEGASKNITESAEECGVVCP